MYFIGLVTLFFNRIFNRISDHHGILTQFFLDPDVISSSHTMLINASTKDFTPIHPIHLVTFSITYSNEVLPRL